MGISLTPEERLEVFGEHDPQRYAEEADRKWGDTEAYRESQRRTAGYREEDWQRIQAEGAEIEGRFAAALRAGQAPDSTEAMTAAEAHRQHINRYFYDCGYPIHRGLAGMYLADHRFTEHYEQIAPGLARYVHDAVQANADRASG